MPNISSFPTFSYVFMIMTFVIITILMEPNFTFQNFTGNLFEISACWFKAKAFLANETKAKNETSICSSIPWKYVDIFLYKILIQQKSLISCSNWHYQIFGNNNKTHVLPRVPVGGSGMRGHERWYDDDDGVMEQVLSDLIHSKKLNVLIRNSISIYINYRIIRYHFVDYFWRDLLF